MVAAAAPANQANRSFDPEHAHRDIEDAAAGAPRSKQQPTRVVTRRRVRARGGHAHAERVSWPRRTRNASPGDRVNPKPTPPRVRGRDPCAEGGGGAPTGGRATRPRARASTRHRRPPYVSTNAGERSRGRRAVRSRLTGTSGRERHPHLAAARAASAARMRQTASTVPKARAPPNPTTRSWRTNNKWRAIRSSAGL